MFAIDFDKVRPLFGGKLTQGQVDGIKVTIDAYNKYGDNNKQRLAQCLGTEKWETAHTMQPIKETQRASDKTAPTDQQVINRLNYAYGRGQLPWVKKPYWKNGWFGRGKVQLTHEFNYKGPARTAVLEEFGVDIHKDRNLVMRPDIAAFILVKGSLEGWFTGKKLANYIDDLDESAAEDMLEFVASRKVINGTDRAKDIAKLALGFEDALYEVAPPVQDTVVVEEPPRHSDPIPPATPSKDEGDFLTRFFSAFFNFLITGVWK